MTKDLFSKSAVERLLEIESSTSRFARLIEENDPARFAKQLVQSDVARFAKMADVQNSSVADMVRQASQVQETFKAIAATPRYLEFIEGTNRLLDFMRKPETIAALEQMNQRMANMVLAVQPVILPLVTSLDTLIQDVARSIQPYEGVFQVWHDSLAERVAVLDQPWAFEAEVRLSALGFARLSRLSDAVHVPSPFEEAVSDFLHEELGETPLDIELASPVARDAAALEAGMQAELLAFPAGGFARITFAAGFKFQFPSAPVPHAIESEEPGAVYDSMHNAVITHLEQSLRQRVQDELFRLEGEKWVKRRVPPDISDRWTQRQEEDRNANRAVYPAIQYADFMDIAGIVRRSNNWTQAFEVIFLSRDEFQVSMQRLHPIRKALGHSRPLGKSDVLTLLSEATRLFRALGINVL